MQQNGEKCPIVLCGRRSSQGRDALAMDLIVFKHNVGRFLGSVVSNPSLLAAPVVMLPKLPPSQSRRPWSLHFQPRPFKFAYSGNRDSNCSRDVCDLEHFGTGAIFPECLFHEGWFGNIRVLSNSDRRGSV